MKTHELELKLPERLIFLVENALFTMQLAETKLYCEIIINLYTNFLIEASTVTEPGFSLGSNKNDVLRFTIVRDGEKFQKFILTLVKDDTEETFEKFKAIFNEYVKPTFKISTLLHSKVETKTDEVMEKSNDES